MSATIESVYATWKTSFSEELWSELQEAKTGGSDDEDVSILTFGPTLPDSEDARVVDLVVHAHKPAGDSGATPGSIHWALLLRRPPSSDPPPEVVQSSTRLGGHAGLRARLERWLTGVPPIASFRTSLRLPRADYRCPLIPHDIRGDGFHDAAASLAEDALLEQIGYRFERSPYGLEEAAIVYAHQEELFVVNIRSTNALRIGTRMWLPHADEIAGVVIKAFFVREGVGA